MAEICTSIRFRRSKPKGIQMVDENRPDETLPLDAGMAAAFGSSHAGDMTRGVSVVSLLEKTHGIHSRVLLRDTMSDDSPVVHARRDESANANSQSNRYQMLGEIARGGVGVIMKGRDVDLGRDVAIKMLQSEHTERPAMVQRFIEEAQIAGQLQHPSILPVYELGLRADDQPFFTMKLIRGKTLSALLDDRRDPADGRGQLLGIFEQVCQATAYAHSRGVVHRDLKPSNIMVGSFGEVQVVDWGLAKVLSRGGATDDKRASLPIESPMPDEQAVKTVRTGSSAAQSIVGSVMGTPAYMSPEQANGQVDQLDERSDVFALGAILCEILTGRPPYHGQRNDVIKQASNADIGDALARIQSSGADERLNALTTSCLSSNRKDRPRDAGVIAREITDYLAHLEQEKRNLEIAAAESRATIAHEKRARRLTTALAISVLFAVLLITGTGAWAVREQSQRTAELEQSINTVHAKAAQLLGQAKASDARDEREWGSAIKAGDQLAELADNDSISDELRNRVDAFLAELERSDTDRRMLARLDEITTTGTTHDDIDSWIVMDGEFDDAFRGYGIDFSVLERDEIIGRMQASEISEELAFGLDLWIRSRMFIAVLNGDHAKLPGIMQEVVIVTEVDTDPYRTRCRETFYDFPPKLDKGLQLIKELDLESEPPETFLLVASTLHTLPTANVLKEPFRKALLLYPDHFQLNHDYAWYLTRFQEWEEAARYHTAAIAIRPDIDGVWRSLGICLRESGDYESALIAFEKAIDIDPDYAGTHTDYALTLERMGNNEAADQQYHEAIRLKSNIAESTRRRAQQQLSSGWPAQALHSFTIADRLGHRTPGWDMDFEHWARICAQQLEAKEAASRNARQSP